MMTVIRTPSYLVQHRLGRQDAGNIVDTDAAAVRGRIVAGYLAGALAVADRGGGDRNEHGAGAGQGIAHPLPGRWPSWCCWRAADGRAGADRRHRRAEPDGGDRNFIVTPLSFLSGTFYSVEAPAAVSARWRIEPDLYLIDSGRATALPGSRRLAVLGLAVSALAVNWSCRWHGAGWTAAIG